jgi:gas vesicle protein
MSNSNYYDYRYADRSEPSGQSSTPGWVLGLLAGAAVGGGIALLFAPRQGTDTRHQLASRGQAAGRQLRQAYESAAGTARRGANRLSAQAQNWRDEWTSGSEATKPPLPGSSPQAVRTTSDYQSTSDYRSQTPPVFRDVTGDSAP